MKKTIMLTLLIICIAALLLSCKNTSISNETVDTTVNENVIQARCFSVNSNSTELNTLAKGTIFIEGADDGIPEHVQIIAWIEIDPNDWGGVAFYIPDNWHVSKIISSYPENETQTKPADYVSTWTTADPKYKLNTMIEVGRNLSYRPTEGGTGTVVIDLVLEENATQPEIFNIMIAVGSDEKGGVKISGPDHIYIEIPISSADNE